MANTLVHETTFIDTYTVEDVAQLLQALTALGESSGGIEAWKITLSYSYRVSLIQETLSDGSTAYEIEIRKAEPV